MKYLLDTNACIGHLRGTSPGVTERLRRAKRSDVTTCSVVRSELMHGAAHSRDPSKERLVVETCGLTVVTHNVGEFSRVPGLVWEDWES